jgi:hypothetical protein
VSGGTGGRLCEKCRASHPDHAKPCPDEVPEGLGRESPAETNVRATPEEKAAAFHKLEEDLGRPLRQLAYVAQILGTDAYFDSIDRAIRSASRQVELWRKPRLPEELWDYPRRVRTPRKLREQAETECHSPPEVGAESVLGA